jgi:hypothetical protein
VNRHLRNLLLTPLLMMLLVSCTINVGASTPITFPFTPDPATCTVEPRSIDSIIDVVGTPVPGAAQVEATPAAAMVVPEGTKADDATSKSVTSTIVQLFACTNAGDFMRVYAYFTDGFLQQFFVGTPLSDDVLAFITATPQPLPEDQLRIIVSIGDVRMLDDGRAAVEVVVDEPGNPRREKDSDVVLVKSGDTWLIDQEVERVSTSTPESTS